MQPFRVSGGRLYRICGRDAMGRPGGSFGDADAVVCTHPVISLKKGKSDPGAGEYETLIEPRLLLQGERNEAPADENPPCSPSRQIGSASGREGRSRFPPSAAASASARRRDRRSYTPDARLFGRCCGTDLFFADDPRSSVPKDRSDGCASECGQNAAVRKKREEVIEKDSRLRGPGGQALDKRIKQKGKVIGKDRP